MHYEPSPFEILIAAAEIRAGWDEATRLSRCGGADRPGWLPAVVEMDGDQLSSDDS